MNPATPLLRSHPAVHAPLSIPFQPISLGNRQYQKAVESSSDAIPLGLALERSQGQISTLRLKVFKSQHPADTARYVERLVKFFLWQVGGWRLTVAGSPALAQELAHSYSPQGARAFDARLMEQSYLKPFEVTSVSWDDFPQSNESSAALGGHLNGCRIGFDLGASDYKLAAVRDGEVLFTTEIPWNPREQPDPEWHFRKIHEGLQLAATHLPRVDAIGGSSAGIIIDNEVRVASLFRSVPADQFQKLGRTVFKRLREVWKVPFEVANDGDVTALAGGMSLEDRGILGIAMGSSLAAGWLDGDGRITGWLNELAFTPIDYAEEAPVDEWSGDRGCGVQYFSQQAVGRLAPIAGISLPPVPLPEQLVHVQDLLRQGDQRAENVFASIGVYYGYALAQFAQSYQPRHVLTLGRVTTGRGGDLIQDNAREVLKREFPELANRMNLHLPDEKSKRHGQAVAAASLPAFPPTA